MTICLAGFVVAPGCGDSSKDDASGSEASKAPDTPTPVDVQPPDYIDVTACASIVDDDAHTRNTDCIACCQQHGFGHNSFICDSRCTCGNLPSRDNQVVCETAAGTTETCDACCAQEGFSRSRWASTGSCSCIGKPDPTVCAGASLEPEPSRACSNCCLEHGYLSVGYSALGSTCTCS
ncbi:hypothetical protein ACFL5O_03010 [Myxococcota bacterium]